MFIKITEWGDKFVDAQKGTVFEPLVVNIWFWERKLIVGMQEIKTKLEDRLD